MDSFTVDLSVTQDDIDRGVPADSSNCPVARRLIALGYQNVEVADQIDVTVEGILYRCDAPNEINDFVSAFDDRGPRAVEPFTVNLLFWRV
jgi:hypothetical protein